MARAKLFHSPDFVWHLTHRCHNRDFLLKFSRDRKRWVHWLFQAKKKYGLVILDYALTSNHIHLLVYDDGREEVIPRSILLTASRIAREYNIRKNRSGAFWEDHYHATAVETDIHLVRCMVYINLNMVRAGVVDHPEEWPFCGYTEMRSNRQRYRLINQTRLLEILNFKDEETLRSVYEEWIQEALMIKKLARDGKWTESIAVGKAGFIDQIKKRLGVRVQSRVIEETNDGLILREERCPYKGFFKGKNSILSKSIKLGNNRFSL